MDEDTLSQCCDTLFNPPFIAIGTELDKKDIGIINKCYLAIMKISVSVRLDLYRNVVISGKTSLFDGLAERIRQDVEKLAPSSMRVGVIAPPERAYYAWIGGSILASLTTFVEMWIDKMEYDENGPSIVHRKCN